jgi:hypothetical protein
MSTMETEKDPSWLEANRGARGIPNRIVECFISLGSSYISTTAATSMCT